MQFTTIDSIVKSVLLRRGYPMHFYLQFLKYGADCVRNLRYRSLPMIKSTIIIADEFGQVPFPKDMEQLLRAGVPNGQFVRPLVEAGAGGFIKNLAVDDQGNPQPYAFPRSEPYQNMYGWLWNWISGINEYGDGTAGVYGYGAGYETDLYEVNNQRRVIQVSQELAGQPIVIDYSPSANSPDNLCQVPAMAQATIEQYIIWQMKEHGRHYSKGEAKDEERMYWNEERILRANVKPITTETILRIFRREYRSSNKA